MQTFDTIRIRGARENNLRDLSLDIPKYKITIFTGVSGSGKSSLGVQFTCNLKGTANQT